ncbi:MAG: acyl-CoA dehydrogenase family protein [Acidimicrobiia bacterium]
MDLESTFTRDEQEVVDGWSVVCGSLAERRDELDAEGGVSAGSVREVGRALATDGWFDVARPGTDLALEVTTLVGMAEAGGRPVVPVPHPVLETWLAVRLLAAADGPEAADLLGAVLGGDLVVTVAVDALGGSAPAGTSGWIPWGPQADVVLVPVAAPDGTWSLHAVRTAEVALRPTSAVDLTGSGAWFPTGPVGPAEAAAAAGPPHPELGTALSTVEGGAATGALATYLVLQAGEMVGSADALLRATVAHLGQREQFGRRLATFQALQHRCADLFVSVETARSLAYYAAWCVEVARDDAEEQAMMAKGYAGEAATRVGDDAIQLHGGHGFTWEGGLHFRVGRIIHRSLTARSTRDCLVEGGRRALRRGRMLSLA